MHSTNFIVGQLASSAALKKSFFSNSSASVEYDDFGLKNLGRPIKTLCLDDDEFDRNYLSEIAKKVEGYEFHFSECSNLGEAYRIVEIETFDLFVIDFWLGGQSSTEFIFQMSRIFPKVPLLVLSSLDAASIREMGRQANATGFLSKDGLNAQKFEAAIDEL